jgi:hypothetical protein
MVVTLSAAEPRDGLDRARQLYNQGQFEAAIAAADAARRVPTLADSADLITARALLERFRRSGAQEDLLKARIRLRGVNPARFSARERVELVVGLGQTLYFENAPGAAAAMFESALVSREALPADARDRVLDWWASALDQGARTRPEFERQTVYERLRARMADELTANPASASASYWAAAAARAQGDLQAAWDAAQAGWVRASLAGERSAGLRRDLDELVLRAIVPERSRLLAQPPDGLTAEWERFKDRWVVERKP